MEFWLERSGCIRCGLCWLYCSAVFRAHRTDHLVQIRRRYRLKGNPSRGHVPEQLVDALYDAYDECPSDLIHLILQRRSSLKSRAPACAVRSVGRTHLEAAKDA